MWACDDIIHSILNYKGIGYDESCQNRFYWSITHIGNEWM